MLIVTPVRHLERVALLTDAELADEGGGGG
jgi:hypothetical protein